MDLFPQRPAGAADRVRRHRRGDRGDQRGRRRPLPAQAVGPAGGEALPGHRRAARAWQRAGRRAGARRSRSSGHRWSAPSYEVRDFLARNPVPYRWFDRRRRRRGAGCSRPPGVDGRIDPAGGHRRTATTLVAPTTTELAAGGRPVHDAGHRLLRPGHRRRRPGRSRRGRLRRVRGPATVLVERQATGGQAGQSSRIENYLGFPDGVSGAQLTDRARRQAVKFGAEMLTTAGRRPAARSRGPARVVRFGDGSEVAAHAVVLATGVAYRRLDAPGVDELVGRGRLLRLGRDRGAGLRRPGRLHRRRRQLGRPGGGVLLPRRPVGHAAGPRRLASRRRCRSYLIEQLRGDRQRPRAHLHDRGGRRARRRPPGARSPCATRATGTEDDRRAPAHLFVFIGAAPRTDWLDGDASPATRAASCSPGPTCCATAGGRGGWALGPRPVPAGGERARRVRGRRRARRVGQAGRLGRRRGRDGRHARAPLPGDAVRPCSTARVGAGPGDAAPTGRASDSPRTSCARCSCSRRSTDDQLDWLAEHGRVELVPAGGAGLRRGRAGRRASSCCSPAPIVDEPPGRARTTSRPRAPTQRGVYARRDAGVPARPTAAAPLHRRRCARVTDAGSSWRCPPTTSRRSCATGSRWRCTCSRACSSGMRNPQASSASASSCSPLGALSAGLTHELNNPAAAAVRATAALRERVAGDAAQAGAAGEDRASTPTRWSALVELQEDAVERVADGARADRRWRPADREDELGDWLEDHGVDGAWDLAPVFVAGRARRRLAGPAAATVDRRRRLERAVRWLAYTLETEHADDRDRGRHRPDLDAGRRGQAVLADGPRRRTSGSTCTTGLESTLVMLTHQAAAASRWSRTTTGRCRRSRPTPASSTRCGPTSSTTRVQAMNGAGTLTDPHGPGRRQRARRDRRHRPRHPGRSCSSGSSSRSSPPSAVGEGTGLGLDIS